MEEKCFCHFNGYEVKDYKARKALTAPEMFGAVGDGVTDDSEAFVNMLNTSGSITLEKGKTYLVNQGFHIPSNVTINGNGATIKIGTAITIDDSSNGTGIFTLKDCTNVKIENVTFDMNMQNMPAYTEAIYPAFVNCAIFAVRANNVTISKCHFINLLSVAIYCREQENLFAVRDCYFESPVQDNGLTVHMEFLSNGTQSFVDICNNILIGSGDNPAKTTGGIYVAHCHGKVNIHNNRIINCGRNNELNHRILPIDFYGDVENISVTDNYIESMHRFVRLNGCVKAIVRGNVVYENSNNVDDGDPIIFVAMSEATYRAGDIVVSENCINITHAVYCGVSINSYISGYVVENVTVKDNIFNGELTGQGVLVYPGYKNVVISGNVLGKTRCSVVNLGGLTDDDGIDGLHIVNNVMSGNRGVDISERTGFVKNTIIKGNKMTCNEGIYCTMPAVISENTMIPGEAPSFGVIVQPVQGTSYMYGNIIDEVFTVTTENVVTFNNYKGSVLVE